MTPDYSELGQMWQFKDIISYKVAFISDTSHKFGGPQITLT